MIEVRSITKQFGGLKALDDVSFTLPQGKIYGLIGPNGSGKTTLVNVITGFLMPDEGEVRFNGRRISGLKPHLIARIGITRTFQSPRVFPELTVEQNILVANPRLAEDEGRLDNLLRELNLAPMRGMSAGVLNFGQRKLLEMARVLSMDPSIIILDEPLSGLDLNTIRMIIDNINYMNSNLGKTLLIIEHNLDLLFSFTDQVIVLHNGRKVTEGPPNALKDDQIMHEVYFGARK